MVFARRRGVGPVRSPTGRSERWEADLATDATGIDTVVVLDELALVRHGVRAALEPMGLEIVAETHSLRDALAFAGSARPTLVVVGVAAGCDPCDAVRRMKALPGSPLLVVLVPPRSHSEIGALIGAGADAVLPRGLRPEELVEATQRVLDGEQVVAPVLQRSLVGSVGPVADGGPVSSEVPADAGLSAREREVLTFLAAGRTNREIAAELSLSLATVKSHLVHVYAKLGVRDRADAVHAAVVRGLLA